MNVNARLSDGYEGRIELIGNSMTEGLLGMGEINNGIRVYPYLEKVGNKYVQLDKIFREHEKDSPQFKQIRGVLN